MVLLPKVWGDFFQKKLFKGDIFGQDVYEVVILNRRRLMIRLCRGGGGVA